MMEDLQPLFPTIDSSKPIIIAGPCSAETEEQVMTTARELAANGTKIFRAGIWKPRTMPGGFEGVGEEGLHGADPKLKVRVDRILDQHGDVDACVGKRIGDFLHRERIGRGACTDPQHVDACSKSLLDMLTRSNFGRHHHACLFLNFLQPLQTLQLQLRSR